MYLANKSYGVSVRPVEGAEEREEVLALRAKLRGDRYLRERVVEGIRDVLTKEGVYLSQSAVSHLAIAADVELNSAEGHVLT